MNKGREKVKIHGGVKMVIVSNDAKNIIAVMK